MTDTTQHDPRDEEIARLREQVLAQQARITKLEAVLKLWKVAGDNAEESELDDYACYCVPMPLFCDADEAMDEALATTDDLSALKAHDDALWNEALTTGIEWQATRGHTLDADDYGNELRSLKR